MKTLSPKFKKLVELLNNGEFHSGQSLGKVLNISRNAVWKYINQLTKYEVALEAIPNKGYQLKQPLLLLDKKIIQKNIKDGSGLVEIEILASIPSTNDYLKACKSTAKEFHVCLSEHQSAGRGRYGRSWFSPFAENIYLSLCWRSSKDISQLGGLSLVVALSVIEVLKNWSNSNELSIKWPNDILWNEKKLAGILIDLQAESHSSVEAIIGIGLNVNSSKKLKIKSNENWTSLNEITHSYHDRNQLAAAIISELIKNLKKFHETGFTPFLDLWKRYDYLKDKEISIKIQNKIYTGKSLGINEYGHLQVKETKGNISTYSVGEISLEKMGCRRENSPKW